MAEKKFYWLKLHRDFFKRHDIRIIESQPNGKDYVLFYLKLLVESIDHEGMLRFSDTIPYNEQMLSTITDTNIDIVRQAVKLFSDLGMMTFLDDGTIHMAEVEKMIGSAADNDNANRQRRFRENQKAKALPERYEGVTKNNESKSKRLEIEIDKENIKRNTTYSSMSVPKWAETEFEEVWSLYPRKEGKRDALKKYHMDRKQGATMEEIKDGVIRYADYLKRNHITYEHTKQGKAFFNQRGWTEPWDGNFDGNKSRYDAIDDAFN